MPRSITILALTLVGLSACSMTVPFERRYPNGKLEAKGTLVRGRQEGLWTFYYDTGSLKQRGRFVKDTKDGDWTWWYPGVRKETEGSFVHEQSSGLWTYWWQNGEPRARGWFATGRRTGRWTFFYENGKPERQGEYANGQRTLAWRFWHPDGSLKASGWFHEGRKIGRWVYRDAGGTETASDHSMPPGLACVEERWDNGNPKRMGLLRDGVPIGRWVTWHDTGPRRIAGPFRDGQPNGPWRAFRPDGSLLAAGPVENGQAVGGWGSNEVRPPQLAEGAWSRATEYREDAPVRSIELWLQEVTFEREVLTDPPPARFGAPADASIAKETARDRDEPQDHARQLFTARDVAEMKKWVQRYVEGMFDFGDAYDPVPPGLIGDRARSAKIVGKKIPVTKFTSGDGKALDLSANPSGRWRVCVILRGYLGQVCPYCPPHIKALESIEKELAELETDLLVVYPGRRSGMQSFLRAYSKLGDMMIPPYRIAYDIDCRLARDLDVLEAPPSALVRSTTLILDATNTIRFAYVATHKADRPPAKELARRLRRLRKR